MSEGVTERDVERRKERERERGVERAATWAVLTRDNESLFCGT